MLQDEELRKALEDLLVQKARETAREVAALVARGRPSPPVVERQRTPGADEAGNDRQLRAGDVRGIVKHAREIRRLVDSGVAEAPPSPEKPSLPPFKRQVSKPKDSGCDVLAILRGVRRCADAAAVRHQEDNARPDLAAQGSAARAGAAGPPCTTLARGGLSPEAAAQGSGPQQDSPPSPGVDRAAALDSASRLSAGAGPPPTGASVRSPAGSATRSGRPGVEEDRLRIAGSPTRHNDKLSAQLERLEEFAQEMRSANIISGGGGDPA